MLFQLSFLETKGVQGWKKLFQHGKVGRIINLTQFTSFSVNLTLQNELSILHFTVLNDTFCASVDEVFRRNPVKNHNLNFLPHVGNFHPQMTS